MKKTLTIAIALLSFVVASAQGIDDAILYSQTFYQGTAKAMGMGNALGTVGGDMTAININPASMGIYRSSELTFSCNLLDNYNSSTYYDDNKEGNMFRFSIPNMGFVLSKERSNYKGLRFTQFGVGLTRTNDFNVRTNAMGINPSSSMIDNYLARIDGYSQYELQDAFPYDIYPAWRTYLIDLYEDELGPYYGSPVPQGNIWQGQECDYRGRSEAWTFAGSANYNERFFIGISIDLAHTKRFGTKVLEESRVEGTETDFNEWSFTEDLHSTGWGGNAKIGFIYHATPWLRFGGAFHSPTLYSFSETWQTTTESKINYVTQKSLSPESHYEYTFIKPLKWVGSLAFVVGQQGMISLDAEYTNFGAARFKANDYDYTPTNEDIKNTLKRTLNFRLGTEWCLGGSYLRLGAAYYGSPFGFGKTGGSVKKASCGISLPLSASTTFDFAYEFTHGITYTTLYDAGELGIEPITHKQFKHLLLTTLKIRF
ncbi:MAG: hypothetical protein K6G25_02240 [Bacteroidales bacterium]|nr:hypothetical protein [Bacteroidales bacterium]